MTLNTNNLTLTILSSIRFDRWDLKSSAMHLMTLWRLADEVCFFTHPFLWFQPSIGVLYGIPEPKEPGLS